MHPQKRCVIATCILIPLILASIVGAVILLSDQSDINGFKRDAKIGNCIYLDYEIQKQYTYVTPAVTIPLYYYKICYLARIQVNFRSETDNVNRTTLSKCNPDWKKIMGLMTEYEFNNPFKCLYREQDDLVIVVEYFDTPFYYLGFGILFLFMILLLVILLFGRFNARKD